MNAFLKWTGVTLGGLIALFLIVGLILPSKYAASRSITINAAPSTVFPLVNSLKEQQKWSPWRETDPAMRID